MAQMARLGESRRNKPRRAVGAWREVAAAARVSLAAAVGRAVSARCACGIFMPAAWHVNEAASVRLLPDIRPRGAREPMT